MVNAALHPLSCLMGSTAPCCMPGGEHALRAKAFLRETFGEATAEVLQRVAEFLAKIELQISGGRCTTYPLLLNLGMIFKHADLEGRYARPPTSGLRFDKRQVMRKAARCAKFVSAACLGERAAIAEYVGGLQAEDIRYLRVPSASKCPGLLVAVDSCGAEIVLCIWAHMPAFEELTDIACVLEPFHRGSAHAGMLAYARSVVEDVQDAIISLSLEFPRKAIAIVGHGFGAGIAVLVMMLLAREGCPLSRAMRASRVQCFAFGPPPTFEPLWALPAWVRASTYAFVHGMDCVPRTCLSSVSRLFMAVKHVDSLPMTALQRLAFLQGSLDLEYPLPDNMDLPDDLGKQPNSLLVVGTVILFYRGEDGEPRCDMVTPTLIHQLLVHRDMANDHIMPLYEQATADVCGENPP